MNGAMILHDFCYVFISNPKFCPSTHIKVFNEFETYFKRLDLPLFHLEFTTGIKLLKIMYFTYYILGHLLNCMSLTTVRLKTK